MRSNLLIDMAEAILPPEPLISTLAGSMVLTRDAFIILKGKTGSGKSRLLCNFMKGLITGDDDIGFVYASLPAESKILYVNTELSRSYLLARYRKMADVCAIPRDEFARRVRMVDLQPIPANERMKELFEWVKHIGPLVVLIDQGADFVEDINSSASGSQTAENFTSLQSMFGLAMIVVLHQNEGSREDSKGRGAIGTALEHKCFSSIVISGRSKYHEISSTKMRQGGQMGKVQVKYNDVTDMFIKTDEFKGDPKNEGPKLKFDPVKYKNALPCAKGDLEKLMAETESWHLNTVKSRIKEALTAGIWYTYSDPEDSRRTIVAAVEIGYGLTKDK